MNREEPPDRNGVLRQWYLAALLHDVGYGVEMLIGVRRLLRFFGNSAALAKLECDLCQAVDQLSATLVDERFVLYTAEDAPGEDHGIVAARHLHALLEKIANDDPSVRSRDYAPAVRAIALHNSRKKTVVFEDDPLAFLLIICDTIQEWGRPRLSFSTAPAEMLSALRGREANEGYLDGPLEAVGLNAEPSGNGTFQITPGATGLHFVLKYDDNIRWNAGVFNLWLDSSCNFQRLDFKGLPVDFGIDVEYVTPLYRASPSANAEQQFHRLRDAVRETHMTFLEDWFPTRAGAADTITNDAVTYACTTPTGPSAREHLTLHLRMLSTPKRITRNIGAFRERLQAWRRYNEDREFDGDYAAPERCD